MIYNATVLPRFSKRKQWFRRLKFEADDQVRWEEPGVLNGLTSDDLQRAWEVYKHTCNLQQDFRRRFDQERPDTGSLDPCWENPRQAFRKSIGDFPALSCVEVGIPLAPRHIVPKDYRSYLTRPAPEPEASSATKALRALMLDTSITTRPLHLLHDQRDTWRFFDCDDTTFFRLKS